MLHTIVNELDIFFDSNNYSQAQYQNIAGGILEYKVNDGRKEVIRLHSTDPYNYLKQEYQPYSYIN